MNEDQTFEALKEILPELEDRLRATIREEYHQQMIQLKKHYQTQLALMEQQYQRQLEQTRKKSQTKVKSSERELELSRQVSKLQKERAQWTTMERHYQNVISQLTSNVNNAIQTQEEESLSSVVPLTNIPFHANQNKQRSEAKQCSQIRNSPLSDSENIHKLSNIFQSVPHPNDEEEEESLLQDRPLCSQHPPKGRVFRDEQMKERGRRQDTQILSPPRSQPTQALKQSLIMPPSQQLSRPTPFFNSQEGKKKLLSMIRNIK